MTEPSQSRKTFNRPWLSAARHALRRLLRQRLYARIDAQARTGAAKLQPIADIVARAGREQHASK
jgi:hypothetical protein